MPDPLLDAISNLTRELSNIPAVPIQTAAKLLEINRRTLYRRRSEFELIRRKGHLFVSLRSIYRCIVQKHYSPTAAFDVTKKVRHPGQE